MKRQDYIKTLKLDRYFKKNWLFLIILFVGMMPAMLSGYSMYLLVALLPIMLITAKTSMTWRDFGVMLFSVTYLLALRGHTPESTISSQVFILLFPWIAYMAGEYIVKRAGNTMQPFLVLVIVVFCLGLSSILLIIGDFALTGEVINMTRELETGNAGDDALNATLYNVQMSLCMGGIGMVFINSDNKFQGILKVLIVVMAALAIMSAIHLLNRTSLVLGVISLFVGVCYPPISNRKLMAMGVVILVALIAFLVFMQDALFLNEVMQGFESREMNTEYDSGTFGGRTDRWALALQQIPEYPLGSKELKGLTFASYAHNTWLDIGVIGGWLPMILFLLFTVDWVRQMLKLQETTAMPHFQRAYLMLISVTLFLQMGVEPIPQGQFQYFLMFFIMWGYMNRLNYTFAMHRIYVNQQRREKERQLKLQN